MVVEKKPGIYLISCLANQRAYVGQSVNVKSRLGAHQSRLKRGNHPNEYLQNAYNKYGVDMFVFKPLEYPEDVSTENLTIREQYWIDFFDSRNPRRGFNMKEAGPAGVVNQDARNKISKALKGKKKPPLTDEHRANLSASGKAKVFTEEHKANISKAQLARKRGYVKVSEETKKKKSEAMLRYWQSKKQNGETV
jgi:group I intron endonuclease